VIVGAGLTGLSAALHLRRAGFGGRIVLIERDDRVGGKTQSVREAGHVFDVTGHWLHVRDERVRTLLGTIFAAGDLVEIERRTGVYCRGVMLPYPFQANLHGLPREVVADCLVEFVAAQCQSARTPDAPLRTFEDFAVARFGRGIAAEFFVPYNRKLWGPHFDVLTPEEIARFVPVPRVDQVISGALGIPQVGLGYNARYLYPAQGGIDALPRALADALAREGGAEVRLGVGLTQLELTPQRIALSDGGSLDYACLISTVPLPALVDACPQAGQAVASWRKALRWVRWRYLDVAVAAPAPIEEHWVYVPAPELPFFRVGIYSNALCAMAPPGHSSLYVELSDRDSAPDLPRVFAGLAELGALRDPADVKFARVRDIDCAYVVFDAEHREASTGILDHFRARGVLSTGRYGAWTYNSMEEAILQGMEAAQWVMS